MRQRPHRRKITLTLFAPALAGAVASAQSFQGMGDLSGGQLDSIAIGVSADGSTVVGSSSGVNGVEAVRWRDGVLVGLGDLPGGVFASVARGANHDGSIIVGSGNTASATRPARWDDTLISELPPVAGHAGYAEGMGVSANGRTLAAFYTNGTITGYSSLIAARVDDGVLTTAPYTPTNDSLFSAQPSEDGRVLSGRIRLGGAQYQACYWVDTTRVDLPKLSGGPIFSLTAAISGDGTVQLGLSASAASSGGEPVRWQGGVAQALGNLPGSPRSGVARSCNRDGSIVVGDTASAGGQVAFIWDATNGMRSLRDVLINDYALPLAGWTLTVAHAMTPDGSVIVGGGINPAGAPEGWIARLGCGSVASYCSAGTTTNGCTATLWASGNASASGAGAFTLSASNVEGQKAGLFFYGVSGALALPWGTGPSLLCVKSPTQRLASQNSGGTSGACDGVLSANWNAFIAANPGALGQPFSAGDVVRAQAWFRDPSSAKTTALSNALAFSVCP
jgi:uncharacterized membrane protein